MAHLGALDRLVKSGTEVPESVLLGTLLVHLGAPALEVAPGADPDEEHEAPEEGDGTTTVHHLRSAPAAEALLEQLVQTSRLPRKVAERIRMALHAQSIFRDPRPKTRRRRRGRGITAQPYFADALMLLRISAEATGEGVDVYHRWAAEAARNPAPPPERSERGGRGGRGDRHPRQGGSRRGPAGQPGQPGQERGGAEHVRHQRPQDRIIDLGPGAETSQPEAARTSGTVEITVDGVFGAAPAEPGGDAPGRRPRRGGRRRRRRGGGGGGGGRAPGEGGPPPAPPA
jgi:poly(A) polymerase